MTDRPPRHAATPRLAGSMRPKFHRTDRPGLFFRAMWISSNDEMAAVVNVNVRKSDDGPEAWYWHTSVSFPGDKSGLTRANGHEAWPRKAADAALNAALGVVAGRSAHLAMRLRSKWRLR